MNRELGLRLLSQVMRWDDEQAREEFHWLSFMAAYKYDGYRDFCAGARFIENLATWLQQFSEEDRVVAYNFVKRKLIYFSPAEIQRLVEKLFPEYVQDDLLNHVSKKLNIPKYRIWASKYSRKEYFLERRKSLFMGLSDGARLDSLRRMNAGVISNEQVVIATQIDHHKWKSLLDDLREDIKHLQGSDTFEKKFSRVYLLDDFTASGTSVLPDPDVVGGLKGKLVKFLCSVQQASENLENNSPFEDNYEIIVHHYIGTCNAKQKIEEVYEKVKEKLQEFGTFNVTFRFGILLPDDIKIDKDSTDQFLKLCEKYYDSAIEGDGKHGGQSGATRKMFGYANCGLPVVLEHNTPNNSLPLIWAETKLENGMHNMRPLFRRRERHSDMNHILSEKTNGGLDE